jgi:superoxide dismutase, Cu-Zn family
MKVSQACFVAMAFLVVILGLAGLQPSVAQNPSARATLLTKTGTSVGEVIFTQQDGGKTTVTVKVHDLPPGFHGFHVHTVGKCDGSTETPFSSAGGHFNPGKQMHPGHAGDLPALLIMQGGAGEMTITTDRFTVEQLLSNEGGTSMIVHAGPDNYANIPDRYQPPPDSMTTATGDSGGRIACGVITKAEQATTTATQSQ